MAAGLISANGVEGANPMAAPEPWQTRPTGHRQLAQDSARGVGSTAAGQVVFLALQIGGIPVLARILTAEDFGVFATLLPLFALMAMLRDFGFQTAIVQQSQLDQRETSTYFWLNLGLCAAGGAVIYWAVPLIGDGLDDPRLAALAPAVSLAFWIGGLSATHDALLRRNLKFGRVQAIRIVAYGIGLIVAITLGIRGHGALALACQQAAEAAALTAGTFLACRWMPSRPSLRSARPAGMRLAGALVMGRIMDYLRQNADRALIRACCSATELGFYDRAFRILAAPLQQVQGPLMAVALPTLSRKRGTDGYADYFLAFVRAITAVTFPLAALGLVFPDEIVHVMLGDSWGGSAPILRGLSLMSISWPLMNLCAVNFVVFECTQHLIVWPAVACAMAVAAFVIGLPWGAAGVATAYGVAFLLLSPFQIVSALRRSGIRPRRFWAACAPPAVAIAISTLLVAALGALMAGWETGFVIRISILIPTWLFSYLGILFWVFDYHLWLRKFLLTAFPASAGGFVERWLKRQEKK